MINFKSEKFSEKQKIVIEENIEGLKELILSCFVKNEQFKKHKVSYLNKIANLAISVQKFLVQNKKNDHDKTKVNSNIL